MRPCTRQNATKVLLSFQLHSIIILNYSCLSVRLGVQRRLLDLDYLVAILSHGAGWKQQRQSHREHLPPRCQRARWVVWQTHRARVRSTLTLHIMSACSWRPSLNKEERSLLLALVAGDNCDIDFCWSEPASTVAATTVMRFCSG